MSYCNKAPKACDIDRCFDKLVVGQVMPDTQYHIHVYNLITGTALRYLEASDSEGNLIVTNEVEYMAGHTYDLHVTLVDDCEPLFVAGKGGDFSIVRFKVSDECKQYEDNIYYGRIQYLKL